MKAYRFLNVSRSGRMLAMAGVASLLSASFAHAATTDIDVWYSLGQHNQQAFEKLVKKFNSDQSDVKVKLKAFDFPEKIESALADSLKNKTSPNLVQLEGDRAPEEIVKRNHIVPLHTLLAKYPIKDAKWFLPADNTFLRDDKNRLLAFPYMVEIPVMYYNIDAFKKAGLKPAEPNRSWRSLQDQLVQLANNGSRKCPLTSDEPVSVNLENLAAVNNQPYISADNGLKAKGHPNFVFDVMFVRHLSVMISWVRSEIMVSPEGESKSTSRFANRECAVLLSSSGNLGWFNDSRSLDFGVAGLPYYPDIARVPGNPFVDGAAFWAVDGHDKAQDQATARFLGWLAQPDNAASWYQQTGFLPLTEQAFAQTSKSYYKNLGDWQNLVAAYNKRPTSMARGFRVNNYPKIKAMLRQTLDRALSGQQPAVTALSFASTQASKIMRQRN